MILSLLSKRPFPTTSGRKSTPNKIINKTFRTILLYYKGLQVLRHLLTKFPLWQTQLNDRKETPYFFSQENVIGNVFGNAIGNTIANAYISRDHKQQRPSSTFKRSNTLLPSENIKAFTDTEADKLLLYLPPSPVIFTNAIEPTKGFANPWCYYNSYQYSQHRTSSNKFSF